MQLHAVVRQESYEADIMKKLSGVVISCALMAGMPLLASAQKTAAGQVDSAGPSTSYPYAGGRGPGMGYQQAMPDTVRGLGYPYAGQGPYPYRGRGSGYGPGGRGYGYGYPGYRGRGGTGYPGHRQYGNPPFYRANEAASD
jgi:hypothetical protein